MYALSTLKAIMQKMECMDMKKIKALPYHHGDLRNSLIAAAEPLLAEKGLTALSLREVAKAAGVSNAAPYRHFKDKAALIEALAIEGFNTLKQGCEAAEIKHADDPAQQLVEAGMSYLFFAIKKPSIVHLMFGGVIALNDCGDELKQAADEAFDSLKKIVINGQQSDIYRNTDPFELTLAAWSTVYGLSLMVTSGLLSEHATSKSKISKLGLAVAETLLSGMLKKDRKFNRTSQTKLRQREPINPDSHPQNHIDSAFRPFPSQEFVASTLKIDAR
jgi:AcrR family transcriptional regulator